MGVAEFKDRLRSARWRPYFRGGLLGLVVAAALLVVWRTYPVAAWVWLMIYMFFGGFLIWWKTPMRKTVSTALVVGTLLALLIQ